MTQSETFQKTASDIALVLGTREALLYPFSAGIWTEIKIGIAVSLTDDVDVNADVGSNSEILTNDPKNNFYLGLKSNNLIFPGELGTEFVGFATHQGGRYINRNVLNAGGASPNIRALRGETLIDTGGPPNNFQPARDDAHLTVDYVRLYLMRYVVTNRGAANQTIGIADDDGEFSSTPTISKLRQELSNWTGSTTEVDWFYGGQALPVPDALFIRWPFFETRLRIHSIVLERTS